MSSTRYVSLTPETTPNNTPITNTTNNTLKHATNTLQAQRTPEEEGDYLVFEQLVAEAAIKKDKDEESKKKKDKKSHKHDHKKAEEVADDLPNVPKSEQ